MALYEYECENCHIQFEQIVSKSDPDAGKCPKCQGRKTRRLISKFPVGGQGDLRESTLHGCHGDFTGVEGDDHGHHHHDD